MNVSVPGQGEVIRFYGEDIQSTVAMEECGELIQAVSKMLRLRHGVLPSEMDAGQIHGGLAEEMADCLIMLDQLQEMYGISDSEIQEVVDCKCRRQEERMHDFDRRSPEG